MKNTIEDIYETNKAIVAGVVLSPLEYSHRTFGESFYTFLLGIERRSGYVDEINIMISERLLYDYTVEVDDFVEITGQIRTYNENKDGRNKLNIVIFARDISINNDIIYYENYIYLEGYLCKPPIKRTSPLGRDICDIMVAVNRMYNKSDYIPCIAWGRNANYGQQLEVGMKIYIEGRIQSREYKKKIEELETENQRLEAILISMNNEYMRQLGIGEADLYEYNESDFGEFVAEDFSFEFPDFDDEKFVKELGRFNKFQDEIAQSLEQDGDDIAPPYEPNQTIVFSEEELEEITELLKED